MWSNFHLSRLWKIPAFAFLIVVSLIVGIEWFMTIGIGWCPYHKIFTDQSEPTGVRHLIWKWNKAVGFLNKTKIGPIFVKNSLLSWLHQSGPSSLLFYTFLFKGTLVNWLGKNIKNGFTIHSNLFWSSLTQTCWRARSLLRLVSVNFETNKRDPHIKAPQIHDGLNFSNRQLFSMIVGSNCALDVIT